MVRDWQISMFNASGADYRRTRTCYFRLSCVIFLTITIIGCSSSTEQKVFDLSCGDGRLVLLEYFEPGFSTDKVTLELIYQTTRDNRFICELRPNIVLYREPAPIEKYHHFRGGVSKDPWPIFVSPKSFTLAEYQQISKTLMNNLSVIDAAVERRDKPTKRLFDNRKPKISSIRYIDINELYKLYESPDKRFKIEVNLSGQIFLLAEGLKSLITKSSVGFITDNGSKVMLNPNPKALAFATDNLVTDLHTFIRQSVNANGHSLYDDFTVDDSLSEELYRLKSQEWMKRRDRSR